MMEAGQLISEIDKKFKEGDEENLESSPESISTTILVPTIKHIAKAAKEELADIPLAVRKIMFENIPLLSQKFSETFSRQFNLPSDQIISHAFRIFTNLAKQQGFLDSIQYDDNRLESHRPYLQYQGQPRPGWSYPPGPSWPYQRSSLPEDIWKYILTEECSSNENKEQGYENSRSNDVSHDLMTVNPSYSESYSAPARFGCVTPNYIYNHRDEAYFCTPVYESTFSSSVSTFSNYWTPINILDIYDPVTPLNEIEVEILEADTIEFIHHQNGDYYLVGEGTYGSVYLAQMVDVFNLVCVKGYSTELSPNMAIVHEAKILTYLQDTGLVPEFHGILRLGGYPGELSLVQEFCSNGITFRDLLKGPENECSVLDRIRILYNLANGLKDLHQKEVLWNDLKANNILVDIENRHRITFIDFGVASFKSGRRFCVTGNAKPFRFLAPEVRDGNTTSQASDIYSLGYLMFKSLRNHPISKNLENVMWQCMNDDPHDRPSIQQIIKILDLFL